MLTDAQNFAVVQTELDELFYEQFEAGQNFPFLATAEDGELFKVVNTTHAAYIGEVFAGSGLWSRIGETETVPESTPKAGNKYTIKVSDFANGIPLSKDWFDDNMHDMWAEEVRNFAMMARATQDINAFNCFNNGFTTFLTADGVPWFSASHVLLGTGQTVSNLISGPLSQATLRLAQTALGKQKIQSGVTVGAFGSQLYLVVPMELADTANQITASVLISDTANNATNSFTRSLMGIKVKTSPYLGTEYGGSSTAWFLLSNVHGLRRLLRQGVQTALRDWMYSTNRTYYYQGNFREEYFCPTFFGSVGSLGTA